MAVTLESVNAAGLATHMLLTTMVRMSVMREQIRAAFEINAKQMREIGLALNESDSYLREVDLACARILRDLSTPL